jgi:hypothetical protein
MRLTVSPVGRAGFRAATFLAAAALAACSPVAPEMTGGRPTDERAADVSAALSTPTPAPSRPTEFAIDEVDRAFPAVTGLASSGSHLVWGSEASIWRFAPGDADPFKIHVSPDAGAVIWDVAATEGAFVFSERLATPAGGWRVSLVADGAPPTQIDAGVAERGAPPTVAIDGRRIAWAGFDEASGSPRTFLRFVEQATPSAARSVLDLDIDDALLWYPQLDRDTLWFAIIQPDFDGTRGGDAFRVETIDLANSSADPVSFEDLDNVFDPAVSPDHVIWKSVEPGLSALTWGDLHAHDRRSNERLVIAEQANHPSIGSRFVAFEEISRQKLLLYDLATRSLVEVPDPLRGARGTVGPASISGNLLGFSVSVKGSHTVYWSVLPD